MRAFVYYNLHKHCLSLKALEGPNKGRVVAHARSVSLAAAQFKVSEAGRQRVLRDKAKNVHAGVVGTVTGLELIEQRLCDTLPSGPGAPLTADAPRATYNPYRFDAFVDATTLERLAAARSVHIDDKVIRYQA